MSEEKWNEVWERLLQLLDGWKPAFNNAFELYAKVRGNWQKVKASEICSTLTNNNPPYEAWKGMPQQAIDYIMSLSEFDPVIFQTVTGLNISKNCKK